MLLSDMHSIELPYETNAWLYRCFLAVLALLVLNKLFGLIPAVGVVSLASLPTLFKPSRLRISIADKRMAYEYSPLLFFKKGNSVSLSCFTRVYTESLAHSLSGQGLHLSGPRGEHLLLARFHQSIFSPRQHIEDAAKLRSQIADTLGISDGGQL